MEQLKINKQITNLKQLIDYQNNKTQINFGVSLLILIIKICRNKKEKNKNKDSLW